MKNKIIKIIICKYNKIYFFQLRNRQTLLNKDIINVFKLDMLKKNIFFETLVG